MSDKEHNIHDFDVALICEYFSSMDRQGPGSPEAELYYKYKEYYGYVFYIGKKI